MDHGLGDELWCCKYEDVTQKYNTVVHSVHSDIPDYLWKKTKVWEFRTFGCRVEVKLNMHLTNAINLVIDPQMGASLDYK